MRTTTNQTVSTGFFGIISALLLSACTALPPTAEPWVYEGPPSAFGPDSVAEDELAPVPMASRPKAKVAAPLASEGRVAALHTPAWVERDGKKSPLKPGARIQAGDTLLTGKGGRVHLTLEDASTVKLGEDAQLEVAQLAAAQDDDGGTLTGTLNVLRGAFRLTTQTLQKVSRRRELLVGVGGVFTAGVRGTDIWGKSDAAQDLICLLEGEIDVITGDDQALHLDHPMTFYVVPRGQSPKPVAPVPAEKLKGWFVQTELAAGTPALVENGAWTVGLVSHDNETAAVRAAEKLNSRGIPAEVFVATLKGKTWHRVALAGFAARADAARFRDQARKQGFKTAWVVAPV